MLQAVTAGGFSREVPASPMVQHADILQIFCRVPEPEAHSQQVVMELWPSLLLHNTLTCPVEWRMSLSDHVVGMLPLVSRFLLAVKLACGMSISIRCQPAFPADAH